MAESSSVSIGIFDCPPTPERLDQCPATPDPFPHVKSPHSTSSAASSDNECSRDQSAGSPPPNCAICLGKCKNKCFTDSCLHQFCFKCLLEWSKVKAECPLCKQSFTSIIHNVKSIDQFEEYLVRPNPQLQTLPLPLPLPLPLNAHLMAAPTFLLRRELFAGNLDFILEPSRQRNISSSYSTTVEVHANPFLHRAELIDRFRQRYPSESIPARSLGQLWRRYVYERRLHALPVCDPATGIFRECSARFYRDNPAQIHRLMPWLNRDVCTLLRDTDQHVSFVLSVVSDLLSIYNINSAEFRSRITPYFRENSRHFIHELLNYARSPYDMIGYDREVRYTTIFEQIVLSATSSSDDSDDIQFRADTLVSRRMVGGNSVDFTVDTNGNSSVRITLGDTNTITTTSLLTPTSDTPSTSQITAINLTTNNTSESSASNVQILGETPVIQIERNNIVLSSSSSSDECEFVLEQKPPHLRTPEMVSLNSASDSDVVFVSEVKTVTAAAEKQENQKSGRKKILRKTIPKGIFVQSPDLDFTTDSDDEGENKNQIRKTTKSTENTRIKDEYNYGASTSSGLRSSGKTRNQITSKKRYTHENQLLNKKFYAKPNLRKRKSTTKSIYEESSSSSSSSTSSLFCKDDTCKSSSSSTCKTSDIFSSNSSLFPNSSSSSDSSNSEDDTKNTKKSKIKTKHVKKSKHQDVQKKSKNKKSSKKNGKKHLKPDKTENFDRSETRNHTGKSPEVPRRKKKPLNEWTATLPELFNDSDSEPLSKQVCCRDFEMAAAQEAINRFNIVSFTNSALRLINENNPERNSNTELLDSNQSITDPVVEEIPNQSQDISDNSDD